MEIRGAHIIVTGAASGLGHATAVRLAELGATVTAVDRDATVLDEAAAAIGIAPLALDVTDENAEGALRAAEDDRGPIRGLVNCAGIAPAGRIVGREGPMPLSEFEAAIRVNLVGSFNMMRLAAARMAAASPTGTGERGVIVNTASVAAFDGQLGQVAYAASKGGVASMALPAARELARHGIRVNTIAPGVFATPMLLGLPQEVQDGIAADIPFPHRLGDPGEFARTVQFIFETPYLNAETIRLDGAVRLPPK